MRASIVTRHSPIHSATTTTEKCLHDGTCRHNALCDERRTQGDSLAASIRVPGGKHHLEFLLETKVEIGQLGFPDHQHNIPRPQHLLSLHLLRFVSPPLKRRS